MNRDITFHGSESARLDKKKYPSKHYDNALSCRHFSWVVGRAVVVGAVAVGAVAVECVSALTVTCQSDGLTQVSLSRTLPSITATEENDRDSNRVEPIESMVIQAFLFLRFVCSFLFLVLSFKSPSGI